VRENPVLGYGIVVGLRGTGDRQQQTNSDLRIEGHTDNIPIHNSRFRSNWDLSTSRATATVRLLIQQYGFSPERLAASGYVEYRPITGNDNATGRAMNRRVDVVVPRKLPQS